MLPLACVHVGSMTVGSGLGSGLDASRGILALVFRVREEKKGQLYPAEIKGRGDEASRAHNQSAGSGKRWSNQFRRRANSSCVGKASR